MSATKEEEQMNSLIELYELRPDGRRGAFIPEKKAKNRSAEGSNSDQDQPDKKDPWASHGSFYV